MKLQIYFKEASGIAPVQDGERHGVKEDKKIRTVIAARSPIKAFGDKL